MRCIVNKRHQEHGATWWVMRRTVEFNGERLHFRSKVGYANALAADGPEQRKYCAERLRDGRASLKKCIAEQTIAPPPLAPLNNRR